MSSYTISESVLVTTGVVSGLGSYSGGPKITYSVPNVTITNIYSAGVSASTAQTYNVQSGLTDAFGNALVYTSVAEVIIYNTSATASLTVGGGSNPLFSSDSITIKAGKCLNIGNVPVTVSGSHNQVTVTPSAASTYQIIILG